MIFTGTFAVPAAPDVVYARLTDAQFFASCVEGVGNLIEVDATHYTATLETRIAYMKFKFAISIAFTEMDPPKKITAKAEGNPLGAVGRLTSSAKANLLPTAEGTDVAYEIDVALAGKLGSIGQPVLKSKAKEMERSFVAKLRAAFQPSDQAETRI